MVEREMCTVCHQMVHHGPSEVHFVSEVVCGPAPARTVCGGSWDFGKPSPSCGALLGELTEILESDGREVPVPAQKDE